MEKIRLSDLAEQKGIPPRTLQEMASSGRLVGATKEGGVWYAHPRGFVLTPPPIGARARGEVMGRTLPHPRLPHAEFSFRSRPVILATYNFAGGAGKSTVALNLAVLLAAAGYKVLAIDGDPQGSLSRWISPKVPELVTQTKGTIYEVFEVDDNPPLPEPIVLDERLHLLPATLRLQELEMILASNPFRISNLHEAIVRGAGESYDVVVLDSPPSLGQITQANLVTADYVIIPIEAASKGIEGLQHIVESFQKVQSIKRKLIEGPAARILALVPTRVESRVGLTSDVAAFLEKTSAALRIPLTPALTSRPSAYSQATAHRTPLPLLSRRSGAVREAALEMTAVVQTLTDLMIKEETEALR